MLDENLVDGKILPFQMPNHVSFGIMKNMMLKSGDVGVPTGFPTQQKSRFSFGNFIKNILHGSVLLWLNEFPTSEFFFSDSGVINIFKLKG